MKILAIITGMKNGGAERVMATLCNQFCRHHEVRLLILKDRESDYPLDPRIEIVSGDIRKHQVIKALQIVRREMDAWKPDVALSFMTNANLLTLFATNRKKIKPVVVIAERTNPDVSYFIAKQLRKWLYPKADEIVFQTEGAKSYYQKILKGRGKVIMNPISSDFSKDAHVGERTKKIINMGRLTEQKNQKLLVEAFFELSKTHPEYILEIYGEGPLRKDLEDQIGDRKDVQLMGKKTPIREYIEDADIFVLSSIFEGLPNALLEAMALGIASIATDCPSGGPRAVIEDGVNGLLIPMNNPKEMTKALQRLIEDPDLKERIRQAGTLVNENYHVDRIGQQWEDLLVESVRKKGDNP